MITSSLILKKKTRLLIIGSIIIVLSLIAWISIKGDLVDWQYQLQEKKTNQAAQLKVITEPTQAIKKEAPIKVLTSREGKLLHKLYLSPDYNFNIETIDIDTQEIIAEFVNNDYYTLVKDFTDINIDSILLKTDGNKRYFVFSTIHPFNMREIYLVTIDLDGLNFQIEPIYIEQVGNHQLAYQSLTFLDYFPETKQLLMLDEYGFGPGGNGNVILLSKDGQKFTITDFVLGRYHGDEDSRLVHRFLAYINNELYAADLESYSNDPSQSNIKSRLKQIFKINPLTRQEEYLQIDLSNYDFDQEDTTDDEFISSTELNLFDQRTEQQYALDVNTLKLRPQEE